MTERTDTERLDWLNNNVQHMVDSFGRFNIADVKQVVMDGTVTDISRQDVRWAIDNKMTEMENLPEWFQESYYKQD